MSAEEAIHPEATDETEPARPAPTVRALWPLAVLAVGGAAIVGGAVWAIKSKPTVVIESPLIHIRELSEAGEYEAALEELNGRGLAYVNLPTTEDEQIRDYFLLRAHMLHEAQARAGVSRKENYESIVQDFEAAEKRGAELDSGETARLAEAYLGADRINAALERVRSLPKSEGERRRKLLKVIVARGIREQGAGGLGPNQVLELLAGLAQEPDLTADDAAWTLARQAELLIGIGLPDDAASKLMREMQLVRQASGQAMGELFFLLGKAHYQIGDQAEATKQLERAMGILDLLDPMQASARYMTAQLMQANGQIEEARDRFKEVIRSFKTTPEYLPSLLGLASALAALSQDDESLETYAALVEALAQRGAASGKSSIEGLKIEDVTAALMARHDDQAAADRTREALRYAVMAESLYTADNLPAPVLLALASSSRRLGNELMGVEGTGGRSGGAVTGTTDQASRVEARQLYLSGAGYYQRHARAVLVTDVAAAARSRWEAADAFDAAGDTESAIKEFTYYAQGASDDDPRRPEAKYRLAQAFQATGDLRTAASLFLELIESKREDAGAGKLQNEAVLWSDRSIVPLARCYATDADAANDPDAEQLLLGVLSGRDLAPESTEFRDALVELGEMYYYQGKYVEAAARLTETQERFPEDREINLVRYRLADSLRLSSTEIDQALGGAMPQSERQELEKTRRSRRREAIQLYGLVRQSLEAKADAKRSDLERVLLRNCLFYQGDCAYDLGDYASAIGYYDDAKQRFASEPASLVAMVQIVNAYVQKGEWAKAATANQRAVQHLEKFPESVWAEPNLPMEKKHWSRWLDSRALLDHRARAEVGNE